MIPRTIRKVPQPAFPAPVAEAPVPPAVEGAFVEPAAEAAEAYEERAPERRHGTPDGCGEPDTEPEH